MAKNFKSCPVDGCNRNAHWSAQGRGGFCNTHFKRWKRHGDPLAGSTAIGEPLRWLTEVALVYSGDDCLTWPFATSADGYPRVWKDGAKQQAHRVVCALVHGPAPSSDHEAAHSCGHGNKGCISPGHLRWATHAENEADKLQTDTHIRGERHAAARLTEASVLEIRALAGTMPQHAIARLYGVSQKTVSCAVRRETWAWLE